MAPSGTLLRRFARLLPRDFRERVFEPALADLLLESRLRSSGPGPGLLSQAILVVECVRLILPQTLWRRGTATRFARATILMAALLLVMWLVIERSRYGYIPRP